jgi:hypothetical protein
MSCVFAGEKEVGSAISANLTPRGTAQNNKDWRFWPPLDTKKIDQRDNEILLLMGTQPSFETRRSGDPESSGVVLWIPCPRRGDESQLAKSGL